jgi:hypothetical protein
MFGHSYFGASYFGASYWGPSGVVPPVVLKHAGYDAEKRRAMIEADDEDLFQIAATIISTFTRH